MIQKKYGYIFVYTKQLLILKKSMSFKANVTLVALLTFTATGCSSSDPSPDSGPASASDPVVLPTALPPTLPPTSSEGGQIGVFNPTASLDVFACEAPYYLELRGLYVGTVSFTPSGADAQTCSWDATLQVRGSFEDPANTQVCDIDSTYSYTLTVGDDSCADGSLESPLIDPLADPIDRLIWENPPYPLDLPTQLEPTTLTASDTIIPLGTLAVSSPEVVWRFDGLGDVILIDTTNFDGTVSGTLLKR